MKKRAVIYIGTSGWSYPKGEGTWRGFFYPPGTKDELEYYSRFFNTVEINSSFYRLPSPLTTARWANNTPDGFKFSFKLWQKFTHPGMYQSATGQVAAVEPADIRHFEEALKPVASQGKLAAVLAQFPPAFTNNIGNRQHLQAVMSAFDEYPLAVELRHRSWSDDEQVAGRLKQSNVCLVQADEPKFGQSIASRLPQTADFSYFRFHGRNADMWWKGDVESRYRYLYSPTEISELADRVTASAGISRDVYVYFNNHYQAYAPRNAGDLVKEITDGHTQP